MLRWRSAARAAFGLGLNHSTHNVYCISPSLCRRTPGRSSSSTALSADQTGGCGPLQLDLPPGASLTADFVSASEHDALVDAIDSQPWLTAAETGVQRRTQQYGWTYSYHSAGNYSKKGINGGESNFIGTLPDWLGNLVERATEAGLAKEPFNQVSVNEYVDGRGIGQHTDTTEGFKGPVASLSLLSPVVLTFRDSAKHEVPVLLPHRSFLCLDGESRTEWSHGIKSKNRARKVDVFDGREYTRQRRIAITFRQVDMSNFQT